MCVIGILRNIKKFKIPDEVTMLHVIQAELG